MTQGNNSSCLKAIAHKGQFKIKYNLGCGCRPIKREGGDIFLGLGASLTVSSYTQITMKLYTTITIKHNTFGPKLKFYPRPNHT